VAQSLDFRLNLYKGAKGVEFLEISPDEHRMSLKIAGQESGASKEPQPQSQEQEEKQEETTS